MNVQPSEREITAAMKRLIGRIPVAGFLAGHGERSPVDRGDRDYNIFATLPTSRASLINQGFDAKEIFLEDGAAIPGDVTAMVVADVSQPLEQWEISAIMNYIDRGGNMIFAVEPGM